MWTFHIDTGGLYTPDSKLVGLAYSGNGEGLNNPDMVNVKMHGPIPPGLYQMGPWFDDAGGKGPIVTHLTPHPTNEMWGREGLMIHGDNQHGNHTASEGCVVANRWIRAQMAASDDQTLCVEAGDGKG